LESVATELFCMPRPRISWSAKIAITSRLDSGRR
jgi:hypothetical protein